MPLYLTTYAGDGTRNNRFVPRGLDVPGSEAIDVRTDCTRVDGGGLPLALLWLPSGTPDPKGSVKIADDHGEQLSAVNKRIVGTKLGLDLSNDRSSEEVMQSVLFRRDIPGGTWKQLRPSHLGRYEVMFGSNSGRRKWIDLPLAPAGGSSVTDNFNRPDENPLSGNWSSPATSTALRIVSNQLKGSGNPGENYSYWNANTFNNDQFSQIQIITAATSGLTVRGSGAATDYYAVQQYPSGSANLFKYVAGTYTSLDGGTYSWPSSSYVRLTVIGSTLSVYADTSNPPTTLITQANDTTFVSGRVGIYDWDGGSTFDNWSGGDFITASVRRYGTLSGGLYVAHGGMI